MILRKYDFTNSFSEYFALNKCFNTRDTIAVGRTFSGLAKLIYPDERMTKEEVRELLVYAIECRRRVKEQLRKMTPGEFSDVDLGYIDDETGEEIIVELPEVSGGTLIVLGYGRVSTSGNVKTYSLSLNSQGSHTVKIDGVSYTITNTYSYGKTTCYSSVTVS